MADEPTEQRPQIEMTVENTWCAVHLEPFRAKWPEGYMVANVLMFAAFSANKDVQNYCNGDAMKLNVALSEFGPVCCLIKAQDLSDIVDVALSKSPLRFKELQDRLLHGA